MMKRISVFFALWLTTIMSFGQMLAPAKWTFTKTEEKDGAATLKFNVKLDEGWHLYSQFTPDGGPLPMVFTFNPSKGYQLIGKVTEPKYHEEYDSTFMVKVYLFEKEATFTQKVKLTGDAVEIKGKIDYQVCKESCIFQDTSFAFTFGKSTGSIQLINTVPGDTASAIQVVSPPEDTIKQNANSGLLEEGCGTTNDKPDNKTQRTLLTIFIAGMLGGFLALLTPCVFPMIPMTVSFFTKRSGSRAKGIRNALIYALSIIVIYVTLGFLVTVTLGSDALNDMSSNAFFNLSFFFIFVIFAISFFGAFEITLPSSFVNKADAASDRGGLLGIFFMAFTLSLVSFSCTGPIIGTLLVEAAHGQSYLGPIAGMTGFSFALAIPFALFAMFPGWLNSLPKSGGWLNTVKVTLGFVELALAMKFLSNVDLAYHWGFLKREIFIAIWITIAVVLGFYLLGKIRLSHDSDTNYISIGRLLSALFSFSFAVYLIPGIWGAPLKLISGFPPPEFYKEWQTGKAEECPHDLNCFHDYDEGMAYAKAQGKPVMIDFTGWACVNCRKMEEKVWSDPKVLKHLRENYVLISLYVDDKTKLPESEQYTSTFSGRRIETTGNKWSEKQASEYKTNSQPYYVLLDNKGKILAEPRGYTPDIPTYKDFLEEGLCRFEKRKQLAN